MDYGPIDVYLEAGAGLQVLDTTSGLQGNDESRRSIQTTVTPAASVGAGLLLPMPRAPTWLHLRLKHVFGGTASYVLFDEETRTSHRSPTSRTALSIGLVLGLE